MKHCPRCQAQYSDEFAYCDVDGTPLVDGIRTPQQAPWSPGPVKAVSAPPAVVTALIGILIGIVLCAFVYMAFVTPGLNSSEPPTQDRESTISAAAPAPQNQIAPAPLPSPTPTAEESPSPEKPEESAEALPAAATTDKSTRINQGPISTGTTTIGEGRTLITMKDGSSVEADAAWEDAEGVWYRRGGLVSFVERAKVQRISELSNRNSPTEGKP